MAGRRVVARQARWGEAFYDFRDSRLATFSRELFFITLTSEKIAMHEKSDSEGEALAGMRSC